MATLENKGVQTSPSKTSEVMTPDMYRSMFWRQFTSQCSQSYDKMMAMGFMYTIEKPLRKIYPNDEDYYAALERHTEFFNITPHVLPFVAGLTVSMEEEAARDKNFDTSSINAMKVGLMGPLSGIGDSFYWGTFRVVAAGIGVGIAATGNPLGPIVYALLYSAVNVITRLILPHIGYNLGTSFLQQSQENHLIDRLTQAAGILGMTVIGAMIASQVALSTSLVFNVGGSEIVVQDLFDAIFPGILPLAATFICVALYKRGVKTIYIIIGIFAVCILGTFLGVFSAA
ncbi:PTS system mannose/fructose/sorbose family transporter subunit IID [Collinsella sp. An2]|uniref:PTS system mannose/fructose/sorbose family transporter subunit IID n=1 Tax=Collinsella sp. An2 TaxID=1965585 RepID=UPI000B380334|nr:PTS system mannose/fructose/sorbose family transporter subunit IID [Collinsella sp. An2]OUP08899.1 PTS mannose transporter subunit IID [Collinsella sp. An2]